jgi:hypothetical protein
MILVQAPDGHEFANSVDESASEEVTESISGNFDDMDMDAILSLNQQNLEPPFRRPSLVAPARRLRIPIPIQIQILNR